MAATRTRKAPRKKTVAKSPPRAPKAAPGTKKVVERYEVQGEQVLKATGGDASKITPALAGRLKMSVGKAQRLLIMSQLKPADRLFAQDLSDVDLGKKLVELRDKQGLRWLPDIWVRTHITQPKAQALYEKAGGKNWAAKNGRKTTTKAAPRKATSRAKRQAKKASTGGGTPRKRAGLLGEVHDPETTDERLTEILEGRRVTAHVSVNGISLMPNVHHVETVRKVYISPGNGRVVEFMDTDKKTQDVVLENIRSVR